MVVQISVAVIAVAFVVLVAFLIVTLRSMTALLAQTHTTMQNLQVEVKGLAKEASDVLRHTNAVTEDVLNKLHSLEPTFDSMKQVGEAVEEITSTVKHASVSVARTIKDKVDEDVHSPALSKIGTALKAIPILVDVWQQFKHRQVQVQTGAK
ncbi:DUF948 domain-containing protein [Paenibacillus radicis (ex Xue et al. 2023)]|uniref:DUF948 domain-containing protein n=1 Tax=Paenibacillus radicis (ex Xue et al. 2023) TaxID=2972489 RepID=A0ABT1YVB7_9BACL|nr:DUF948 domain-containing protein [Paenibacillus radicis (ex Xue et al. 2023)]MCR8636896.1 DUF948 domain-containing protein [Paenibacillus radicis (ex Xue et al. 2023)]